MQLHRFFHGGAVEVVVLTYGCRVAGMESPGSEKDAETAMPEDQLDELLRVS
jgi:hypothetical protein